MPNLILTESKRKSLLPAGDLPMEARAVLSAVELTLLDVDALDSMNCQYEAKRLRRQLMLEINVLLGGAW